MCFFLSLQPLAKHRWLYLAQSGSLSLEHQWAPRRWWEENNRGGILNFLESPGASNMSNQECSSPDPTLPSSNLHPHEIRSEWQRGSLFLQGMSAFCSSLPGEAASSLWRAIPVPSVMHPSPFHFRYVSKCYSHINHHEPEDRRRLVHPAQPHIRDGAHCGCIW